MAKGGNVLLFCHAVFNQLCIAGNACQRGFQLVADISGKLPADGLIVLPQLAVRLYRVRQRDQLLIRHIGLDAVQVLRHLGDGLHQMLGNDLRQHQRQNDDKDAPGHQNGQHAVVAAPHVAGFVRQPQNASVRQAHGIIMGVVPKGCTAAHAGTSALCHSLLDLWAVGMVGQGAGISSGRIVQNGAILGHKGQTQAVCILGQLLWLWVGRMLIPHRNSFHRAGKVGVKLLGKSVLEQQRCPHHAEQEGQNTHSHQSGAQQVSHAARRFDVGGFGGIRHLPRPPCPWRTVCTPPCARCRWRPRRGPAFGAGSARACQWCGFPAGRRYPTRLS